MTSACRTHHLPASAPRRSLLGRLREARCDNKAGLSLQAIVPDIRAHQARRDRQKWACAADWTGIAVRRLRAVLSSSAGGGRIRAGEETIGGPSLVLCTTLAVRVVHGGEVVLLGEDRRRRNAISNTRKHLPDPPPWHWSSDELQSSWRPS